MSDGWIRTDLGRVGDFEYEIPGWMPKADPAPTTEDDDNEEE